MKKTNALLFIAVAVLLCSCALFNKEPETPEAQADSQEQAGNEETVEPEPEFEIGVFIPDGRGQKWLRSADYLTAEFEGYGHKTEIFSADNDAAVQAAQIEAAVQSGVDCVVVAAVDSYSEDIRAAVENAKNAGIHIIAYDRLVMDTEAVDIFIAFDPYITGRMCAKFVETALLAGSAQPNMEFFMGGEENSSAKYFYSGVMDVLMPYIDAGKISVPSGRKSFEQTSIAKPEAARGAADALIKAFYSGERTLDAVVASDDAAALGVIGAVSSNNASNGQFPVITGVGAHAENIIEMIEQRQQASIFGDERLIAEAIADSADWLLHGRFPNDVDRTVFFNGKIIVPALMLEPVLLDTSNFRDVLIGGEYYSYTDIYP